MSVSASFLMIAMHQESPSLAASAITVVTPEMVLRQWSVSDHAPFAAMNADEEVMRYFPRLLTRKESDATIALWRDQIAERGWGNWAVELRSTGEFIGFVGLTVPRRVLPFSPCVEIGWRIARAHWGKGLATQAAHAALGIGFGQLGLRKVVSFTSVLNLRSRAVMERIGMVNTNEDFDHPGVPEDSPLRRHCLYHIGHPST